MKTTVNFYDFRRAFEQCRPENFSNAGLVALFDYLKAFEDDTGEEVELDVIGFCCDYSEEWADEIADNYGIDLDEAEGDPEAEAVIVRDYLQDNGVYVGETGHASFVYRKF